MKAGEKDRVGTLRLINSAIKSADIDARPSGKDKISDADILSVLAKMVKQRRDSIEQFRKGGRDELADKEAAEIVILEAYLPPPIDAAGLEQLVNDVVTELNASGPKDLGKVMKALMPRLAGQAVDGKAVTELVKRRLG